MDHYLYRKNHQILFIGLIVSILKIQVFESGNTGSTPFSFMSILNRLRWRRQNLKEPNYENFIRRERHYTQIETGNKGE